jgi:protocatechuate 3,4-dioxygenase beta subunit
LRNHRVSRIAVAIAVFAVAAAVAGAQNQNSQTELRTVHGVVLDKGENPVASSIVYLLNTKTQAVRTYIADSAGRYRFSGLDPNVDYEIHAAHGDLTSSTRTISSFDSRRDIEMVLKLSHKKSGR